MKHTYLVSKENKMTLLTGSSELRNVVENLVQSNLSTMATLETDKSGCCRIVTIVEI